MVNVLIQYTGIFGITTWHNSMANKVLGGIHTGINLPVCLSMFSVSAILPKRIRDERL